MIMIVSICFSFNSSNMRMVNNMRAKYLYDNEKVIDFGLDICRMIRALFERYPSFVEKLECNECHYSGHKNCSMMNLNDQECSSNLQNIEKAIISKTTSECPRCQHVTEHNREFGPHIFLIVSTRNGTVYLPVYSRNLAYFC